jgi:hypothetical protein
VIEVELCPQRQLLANQRLLTPAQQSREPGLGAKQPQSALATNRGDELTRVCPQPVRHLFAEAVPDPGDQEALATDRIQVGVCGRHAKRVKGLIQDGQVLL